MRFKKRITKLLGELLVEKSIITAEQLEKALEAQLKSEGLIGEVIVNLGFTTEEEIAQCLAHQYGFAYLPLENYNPPKEIIELIPKNVASHYCLIPLDKMGNTLTVAMANPLNVHAIEDIEDITAFDIQIFISTPTDIRNAINKHYGEE